MGKWIKYSEDGASETVGYLLLISIVIIVVGMVTVLATPIIEEAKQDAYLKNMEQGFTVLDSRGSMVALGKSPSQAVQIYTQTGNIIVDNNTFSNVNITFSNGTTEFSIYDEPMGTIEYRQGENTIAYEGGGVFRKYTYDSDPVMLSPPEFHYNGETLTMPIIKIKNNYSAGGHGVVTIFLVSNNSPIVKYPNPEINSEYKNPLLIGKTIYVTIKSEYYMAWAKYIEERTEATALTNNVTKEVKVILNTKPNNQDQNLDPPIDVYGFNVNNDSSLHNLSMFVTDVDNNFKMKMTTSSSFIEPYFIFSADKSKGMGTSGIFVELTYYDMGKKENWEWDVQALKTGDDFDIDFLSSNGSISYTSNSNSWTWDDETSPYNMTYDNTVNDTFPLGNGRKLFQHYMSLVGPTFSFYPLGSPYWDGFNPNNSTFVLYYEVMPPRITYLHVVEHSMRAELS